MNRTYMGFTLVELMVVVLIVAIMAAIAMPMYNSYSRKAIAAQVMQEMQKISDQLERHKSKNFSYKNFNPIFMYSNIEGSTINIPVNSTGKTITYRIYVREFKQIRPDEPDALALNLNNEAATGKQWVILAEANSTLNFGDACTTCNSLQQQNYSFLLSSTGIECKTKGSLKSAETLMNRNLSAAQPCGSRSEEW